MTQRVRYIDPRIRPIRRHHPLPQRQHRQRPPRQMDRRATPTQSTRPHPRRSRRRDLRRTRQNSMALTTTDPPASTSLRWCPDCGAKRLDIGVWITPHAHGDTQLLALSDGCHGEPKRLIYDLRHEQ